MGILLEDSKTETLFFRKALSGLQNRFKAREGNLIRHFLKIKSKKKRRTQSSMGAKP